MDEATLKAVADPNQVRFDESLQFLLMSDTKLVEIDADEDEALPPRNFCLFQADDRIEKIPKATLLWRLSSEGNRVSTDRVYRFVDSNEKVEADDVHIGDFIYMMFKGGNKSYKPLRSSFTLENAFTAMFINSRNSQNEKLPHFVHCLTATKIRRLQQHIVYSATST